MSQYKNELQRECCLDGMRDSPTSYTCEIRSEYITDGAACIEAFLQCCKEMESQRTERMEDQLQLARSKRRWQGKEEKAMVVIYGHKTITSLMML